MIWLRPCRNGGPQTAQTRVAHGLVIHNGDRDSLNDAPANLQALTRKEHADEHRGELESARALNGVNFTREREMRRVVA